MNRKETRRKVEESLADSAFVKLLMLQRCSEDLVKIGEMSVQALKKGRALYFCGNGGSAADSQHIAAELVGRFLKNRRGLPASALTTNTSSLTAIGNDFSYEETFSRQVEAYVKPGDVVFGISTSGNSGNVIAAMRKARKMGAKTVGFTNGEGGKLPKEVDACLKVPSKDTQRVQEGHIAAGHIICDIIEREMFG